MTIARLEIGVVGRAEYDVDRTGVDPERLKQARDPRA
jgi:hypothetical protein